MTTKFICEIGSNHNRNVSRTIELIEKAKEIGCWAVKFQYFDANKLYAPEFEDKIDRMVGWELPTSFIPEIRSYCNDLPIKFICSVFDVKSVAFVKDYIDLLKVGSYELLNHNLIEAVVKTHKPWILSTGMGTEKEILNAVQIGWRFINLPHTLLHCTSDYPALASNCDLLKIRNLKKLTKNDLSYSKKIMKYGWSDHTVEPGVIYEAIALGAEVIEFHMDLEDGNGFEYTVGHCWLPSQIKEVIRNVKIGKKASLPVSFNKDYEIRKWRMDPEDGMRPLKQYRKELLEDG